MRIADLTSPRAKLGRANEHLAVFNEELLVYRRQNAQSVGATCGRKGDWYVVELNPIPTLPRRMALIAGDCLSNLRAALDHLVWQFVLREDQQPTDTNTFPLYETEQEFLNKVETPAQRGKRHALEGITLGGDAWTLIAAAQPYQSPQPQVGTLADLARLTNFDKHRTMLIQQTFLTSQKGMPRVFWRADVQPIDQRFSEAPLSAKRPTEIARFLFAPGVNPGMDMEGKVTITPFLSDGVRKVPVGALGDIYSRVGEILYQAMALPRVQG